MGNQDTAWNGLDEEIVRAGIQNAGYHAGIVKGGKDEDRDVAEAANGSAYFPAIHVRHHKIEEHNMWKFFSSQL
jgi:hypothetical protein